MSESCGYAAFISYSSKDARFAKRLHRSLERYRIPRSVGTFDLCASGKQTNRIYPVFRDREELPVGALDELIKRNLRESRFLIVVCSPHSAASKWVNAEIDYFASLGREHRIFGIVASDARVMSDEHPEALTACLPASFVATSRAQDAHEALVADTRPGHDDFRSAWLKIVAGMAGVNLGKLIDRDRKVRERRGFAIGASVLAATSVAIVTFAAVDTMMVRASFGRQSLLIGAQDRAAQARWAIAALGDPTDLFQRRGGVGENERLPAERALHETGMLVSRIAEFPDDASFAARGRYVVTRSGREPGWLSGEEPQPFTCDLYDAQSALPIRSFVQTPLPSTTAARRQVDISFGAIHRGPKGCLISPDGNSILAGDTLYDVRSGRPLRHDLEQDSAEFLGGGRWLSTPGAAGARRYWSAIDGSDGPRGGFDASPDGAVYILRASGRAVLHDARSNAPIADFGPSPYSLFSPDGTRLVVAGANNAFSLRAAHDGRLIVALEAIDVPNLNEQFEYVAYLMSGGSVAEFSADGSRVVMRGVNDWTLYDAEDGAVIARIPEQIQLSPDGTRFLMPFGNFNALGLFDGATGVRIAALDLSTDGAANIGFPQASNGTFSPRGDRLLVGNHLFDTRDGRRLAELAGQSYAFTSDGGWIGAVSSGQLVFYDASAGTLAANFAPGEGEAMLAGAPPDRVLVGRYLWRISDVNRLRGSSTSRAACATSRDAIGPFTTTEREPGAHASAEARFLAARLQGRPWNVCEWRGLGSIGGWAQMLRRWHIMLGGAEDYPNPASDAATHARPAELAPDGALFQGR